MNKLDPKVKIEIIERSLKCFWLGVFSLIPVFGVPLSIMALRHNRRIRQLGTSHWNPAERYRYWGALCARLSDALVFIFATAVIAFFTMLNHWPTYH